MNWRDCVAQNELFGIRTRFDWPVGDGKGGFDCNDATTINDFVGGMGMDLSGRPFLKFYKHKDNS